METSGGASERPGESGEATIEVRRAANKWSDRRRAYKVMIDGSEVGKVDNGESEGYRVAPGVHEVYLKIDWCRSEKLPLDVGPGETKTIEANGRNPFAILYWITIGRSRYIAVTQPA